jgi:hypothetical protein
MVDDVCGASQSLVTDDELQLSNPLSEEQAGEVFPGEKPAEDPPEELPFEERVFKACHLLQANPLNRIVLYRTLQTCVSECVLLNELETFILEQPESKESTQPPYFLIDWLVDYGMLDVSEIDFEGNIVEPEQKEGLSEDEIDDLIDNFAFSTNEVGKAVIEEFSPRNLLGELLEVKPDRYDTYIELLEFLQEPRAYLEVDNLLRGRDVLMSGRGEGERPMQPSVFVDKLAASGSITFKGGWVLTGEGKEWLDTVLNSKG